MATFHYLSLRAFAHETEDPARVRAALQHVVAGAEVSVEETAVEGSHKNRIRILEAELKSAPAVKRVFAALAADDPRGWARLLREVDQRLDENLNFYLRLDKQAAYQGRTMLAGDDDAITVRGKIRSFQSKRSGEAQQGAHADLLEFLQGVNARASGSFGQ